MGVLSKGSFRGTKELGKGRFGTSSLTKLRRDGCSDQKFLPKGTQLLMKKLLGEVKVTEKEFKTVFRNCRHENVVTPRAYYLSNNGNYHSQGSVYEMLRKGLFYAYTLGRASRLKVAIEAARGIAHIHDQCDGNLAHGNIRSSNNFLNSHEYGCVADSGLADIMRMPGELGALDYHASEYEFKNASHESDVYSFGVVLLDLASGRLATDQNLIGRFLCNEVDMLDSSIDIEEFQFKSTHLQIEDMLKVGRAVLGIITPRQT